METVQLTDKMKAILNVLVQHNKLDKFTEGEHFMVWYKNNESAAYDKAADDFFVKKITITPNPAGYYPSKIRDIVRYSKKFNKFEVFQEEIGFGTTKKGRTFARTRVHKQFRINENGILAYSGATRYLSLKNIWTYGALGAKLYAVLYGSWIIDLQITERIEVPNKITKKCKSVEDLIVNACGSKPFKIFMDNMRLSALLELYTFVPHNELHKISNYIIKLKNSANVREHAYLFRYSGLEIVHEYYLDKFKLTQQPADYRLRDLLNMQRLAGIKWNLNYNSNRRIVEEHDKASKTYKLLQMKEFKVNKAYENTLCDTSNYSVELITNKSRLLEESNELHHCVWSYYDKINSGKCAIFSVVYEGNRYTLEVRISGNKYANVQFRGLHNCNAPIELHQMIDTQLNLLTVPKGAEVKEIVEEAFAW